ncbi:hypothetical protein DBR06_SOUSAS5410021, partial [Sousa chinensis]
SCPLESPGKRASELTGGVCSKGPEPTASSRALPPPTPLLVGEKMVGQNSAIAVSIGYCIYFDRKRRSDPNFKNRVRERGKKQKLAKERAGLSKLPDLKDAEGVQKFFLEEIQLGEELLAQGEYEKGVDHLTNAIAVCGHPQQLLGVAGGKVLTSAASESFDTFSGMPAAHVEIHLQNRILLSLHKDGALSAPEQLFPYGGRGSLHKHTWKSLIR